MEEYSRIKEENYGEQLPVRDNRTHCGKKESKETLATDKETC
jgi:hypothetical protein